MSQIHVDPEEFADIVMAFLLDAIRQDGEMLSGNEEWAEFVKFAESRGMKPKLMNAFLKMDGNTRVKYKRIRDVFEGGDKKAINILQDRDLSTTKKGKKPKKSDLAKLKDAVIGDIIPDELKKRFKKKPVREEFDRELCKRVFRKVKDVRFKTSKPITEERLDKIIDYCIKEKEERKNE